MKKFYLLTKTLLVVALLMIGANAWADVEVTETYDFASFITANGTGNLTTSGDGIAQSGTSAKVGTVKVVDNLTVNAKTLELNGRFAVDYQYNAGSQIRFMWRSSGNNYQHGMAGQWNNKGTADPQGAVRFSILNLKAGDKITLTYFKQNGKAADPYTCSGSQLTDVAVDVALSSNTEYTVAADGNVDLYFTNNNFAIASVVIKTKGTETVTDPTLAVTGAAGVARSVTITAGTSSASNTVTTYYTVDGTDPTTSSSSFSSASKVITVGEGATEEATITVKALSISSASVESGIGSLDVTVGEPLTLVAPTFAKTNYSSCNYTVNISSDQSSIAGTPSPTYYYRIGTEGDFVAYSTPVVVPEGETIYAYASCSGYINSDNNSLTTAVRPALSEVWSIDFTGQATEDKGAVTVGEKAFDANGVDFSNISGSFTSNDNFGVKTGSSWLLRNTGSTGLYSFNGGSTPVGVAGLKEGQYVKMVVAGMDTRSVSGAASLVDDMSTTTELCIVANEDGNACINFNRYAYIKSIAVFNVSSVSATITSAGYATFSSKYAVSIPDGVEAYAAKLEGDKVTLTKVDAVPANTGVILKAAEGIYNLPVVASADPIDTDLNISDGSVTGDESTIYVLGDGKNGVGFYWLKSGNTLEAGKAYLLIGGGARGFIGFEGATGINGVNVNKAAVKTGKIYNLNGQIVSKPSKGLFIVDGKVVSF